MKRRFWRFVTDPNYPDAQGRRRLHRSILSAAGIALFLCATASYTIWPLILLIGGVLGQRSLTAAVPTVINSPEDAERIIEFCTILVGWRWVFLCLCVPLAWIAARGQALWIRLFAAAVDTFIIALIYFEALKSNDLLEALRLRWSGQLPEDASRKLAALLFWFDGWQIGLGIVGLGIFAGLVGAQMSEREKS
ncbi:MAG TPA: hypothetical protein VGG34_03540 [Opitutaceae bacterium]|jgi:hypothetical protein